MKNPLKSKTLWFNTLSIIAIAIASLQGSPEFKEAIGGYIYWLMAIGAIINAILRFYTIEPITSQKKQLNPLDAALRQDAEEHMKDF